MAEPLGASAPATINALPAKSRDDPTLKLVQLTAARRVDFDALMASGSADAAACRCTAYHGAKIDQEGAGPACRARLLNAGQADGFLLCRGGRALAWCQCAPWESFALLARRPPPLDGAWALTCIVIPARQRGQGLAHALVAELLRELRRRGARSVVAFGHRLGPTYGSPLPELPERVCVRAGMRLLRDDPECPLYGLELDPEGRRG